MVDEGIVLVHAHDRLGRLGHVLRRVDGTRRRLEVVMSRVHGAHLLQMGLGMHHVVALLHVLRKLLAHLELVRGQMLGLLLLGWRAAAVLVHKHGRAAARLLLCVAVGPVGRHGYEIACSKLRDVHASSGGKRRRRVAGGFRCCCVEDMKARGF